MTKNDGERDKTASMETILTHGGRASDDHLGFVNMPVFRGSTILFKTLDELEDYKAPYRYGRNDNPTTRALCDLVSELEGAAGTVVAPSGLSAVSTALLAAVSAGDELLMTDSAYEPTRTFASEGLARFGVTTRYYDPRIGAGIAALFTERTKAVFVETPGSLTFEMQDLPAIAGAAEARGITVIVDNSWATPLYHRPLQLGADMVMHAATKMFVGHSDAMVGTVSANEKLWGRLKRTHRILGVAISPDDSYLTLRGLRTLAVRMKHHSGQSAAFAAWLQGQPEVEEVYHPALPDHPDHAIFKRDFTGAGSLFTFRLKQRSRDALAAMVNGFQLFGMGYSWGGYESLCIPFNPTNIRTAVPWTAPGQLFRVHVGLESLDDLKADMSAALQRYRAIA
ncbi:cystathionine beta-lyase [Devosia sp. A16]|uniref:cystathionine beta-lyase n=1 Tax=Devosia sp. A16 TaxID=1736675 RepID=UPI0006D82746|nr:cystathionine beta-lyase [Devosia sp. A16]